MTDLTNFGLGSISTMELFRIWNDTEFCALHDIWDEIPEELKKLYFFKGLEDTGDTVLIAKIWSKLNADRESEALEKEVTERSKQLDRLSLRECFPENNEPF